MLTFVVSATVPHHCSRETKQTTLPWTVCSSIPALISFMSQFYINSSLGLIDRYSAESAPLIRAATFLPRNMSMLKWRWWSTWKSSINSASLKWSSSINQEDLVVGVLGFYHCSRCCQSQCLNSLFIRLIKELSFHRSLCLTSTHKSTGNASQYWSQSPFIIHFL